MVAHSPPLELSLLYFHDNPVMVYTIFVFDFINNSINHNKTIMESINYGIYAVFWFYDNIAVYIHKSDLSV